MRKVMLIKVQKVGGAVTAASAQLSSCLSVLQKHLLLLTITGNVTHFNFLL